MKTSVIHPKFLFTVNERAAGVASLAPLARLSITESSSVSKPFQGQDHLIVCNPNEVRCFSSQSKDRISKVEWKMPVKHVELIERGGAPSWVAVSYDNALTSHMHRPFCSDSLYPRKRDACILYPPSRVLSPIASRRRPQQVWQCS
jgi:hypothetical protein